MVDNTKPGEVQHLPDPDASVFYTEADALEDAILFPDELVEPKSKSLYKGKANDLENFVRSGPDWGRFINDLDTDEELSDTDCSEDGADLLEDGSDDNWLDETSSEDLQVQHRNNAFETERIESIIKIPDEVKQDLGVLRGWESD